MSSYSRRVEAMGSAYSAVRILAQLRVLYQGCLVELPGALIVDGGLRIEKRWEARRNTVVRSLLAQAPCKQGAGQAARKPTACLACQNHG